MKNQPWLVSFGDLLTLLLCFFVTIIAQSPLNPRSAKSEALREKQEAGTEFAPSVSRSLFKTLTLSQQDFQKDSGGIAQALKSSVILDGYEVSKASLSSCSPGVGETSWFEATKQALSLRRQLIDAGVASPRIEISVRGPNCENAAWVSKIDFDFIKRIHG